MEELFIDTIIPVILILCTYLLIQLNNMSWLRDTKFIKARIIIGSAGIGYFLALAVQSGKPKDIILTCLFALLLIYGVLSLQNKYMKIKKPES